MIDFDNLLATAKPRRVIFFGGGDAFRWENHAYDEEPISCKLHDDVFYKLEGGKLWFGDEREYPTEAAAIDALREAVRLCHEALTPP